MALSLSEATAWAGDHPYLTGGIVVAGGLAILYFTGFFGGGGGGGQTSGAAAFYQAEAAQAAIGGQIQIATLQTAAATNQAGIAAKNSEALARIQSRAAITLNQQNATEAGHLADISATSAVNLATIGRAQAVDLANIGTIRDQNLAGIAAGVANHLADTQYLATVNNNQSNLAAISDNNIAQIQLANINASSQAAHDAAALQYSGQQLEAHRQTIVAQMNADQLNFLLGANTGFRRIAPASGGFGPQ